ncbi:MAG: heparinase II/III family protein [Cyclobacteriaceae bacterium]|nr:heparinase II/III family protein [Cyclobacteriaceae bacterium]
MRTFKKALISLLFAVFYPLCNAAQDVKTAAPFLALKDKAFDWQFQPSKEVARNVWQVANTGKANDGSSVNSFSEVVFRLENPITESYLKKNLKRKSPKIILTPKTERELKSKLKFDPVLQGYFSYLKSQSDKILNEPLLKRELEGFRLLAVSRQMVERMGILCMVYRLEKSPAILQRINQEILAVCAFEDWNPQHFLDVGEMSFAVAMAVDWVGKWLPSETVALAKESLIDKGIKESYNEENPRMFWINSTNNWNAVCHGGMIAAALVTADVNPELSARTIARALDKLPSSLSEYAPHGVYPEGATYWGYGTMYSVLAANMLESALGSDFGISKSPGFMQGPVFISQVTAPSGEFFNFADCGDYNPGHMAVILAWFAAKTGNSMFFHSETLRHPESLGRMAGPGLIWASQFKPELTAALSTEWFGNGKNPVAVFRDKGNDFFLAMKGGKANLSHGNMDAGTFVFELNGIRWIIDPGNQSYYPLNRIGFNLAGHCQDCPRWTLLTKKNQGHSTITINNERFDVDATAKIIDFTQGDRPEISIDMTPLYFGNVDKVTRRFVKESNISFYIEDHFEINEATDNINWGLMTLADVQLTNKGAVLTHEGKELLLEIEAPEAIAFSVISLDPPPMQIDKTIENLKRIEINIPAWTATSNELKIRVRFTGN